MKRSPLATAGLYGTVVIVCAALLFPIYWMLMTALSPANRLHTYPPTFVPPNPQWNVFWDILQNQPFGTWVVNTLLISLATMILSLTFAILAAYALSRHRLRGGTGLGLFILTAKMLPATLLVIPLFAIFKSLGLIGSPWSVVIAMSTMIVPFATWMLKGYFDTIPVELEHAALVDGCSPLAIIFRIILPVAAPGVAATALYSFVISWSDVLFGRTFLVQSESRWTVSMGIAAMKGEFTTDWNVIMAASLMATVPIIIVFLVLERYLVGGLAAGAEK